MLGRSLVALAGVGVVLGALTGNARAGGCEGGCEDGFRRAGYPDEISCLAAPSDTGHYVGYYVGGGAPCLGEPRCAWEGTWGWDYSGLICPKRIMLQWYHGRRYQGGYGSYSTAGTKCRSNSTP